MALRVTTTGTDVFLADLGVTIVHPAIQQDLSLDFTAAELRDSDDLTTAIQGGTLLVDDGQFQITSTDYDRNEVVNQELGLKLDTRFTSHDELLAGDKNVPIFSGVFPIALNSTSSVSQNVYSPAAKWGTWALDAGDIVVISGSTAADGTYTVASVTDEQNFLTVEPIPNSTGGTLTAYHPIAASRIGIRNSTLQWSTSADTLQEALDDLSITGGGITDTEHRELDQLVHNIAEDSFEEYTYSGFQVINITAWTDNLKTTKIREQQFTYTGLKINTITTIQYDDAGVEVERITETFTYTGLKVTSIDRDLI